MSKCKEINEQFKHNNFGWLKSHEPKYNGCLKGK